ncbi:MAG: response regulator, partial [Methanoregula sp.]|nr:response regulator [Methanoregula sp.]
MNSPLSDGNENTIDIFVLSTSSTESPVQAGSLDQLGYRITFFTDSKELFESLRSGKPNLLICDSVTFHDDAYDLCHSIKADPDLWVVPVLIVTAASNLIDLLHVLDCNADNFISYPYDPPYLSSLIEGMLSTPVARQTPEQIKTQFKIQHDEHMFVVTADRRKLLEFLLSSFEIAVNRSGDLSRVKEENNYLSGSLNKTEELSRDQARSIEDMNTTLRHNEQEIGTLVADNRNKDQQIAEITEELQRLNKEIESEKSLLAAADEQIRRLNGEAEECTQQHAAETGELRQQLSTLSDKFAAINADLQATKDALTQETRCREDTEKNLSETTIQQEQAEKTARALTLECEQMRVSLAAEKNRAQSAEHETKSLLQAKTESEQDLTRIISELKNTAKQQGADLNRQKEELDNGKNRIINLEVQLANLNAEKERGETELQTRVDTCTRNMADLQGELDSTRTTLEEREREVASLKTELWEVREARDITTRDQQALSAELSSLKAAFAEEKEERYASEERLNGEIRERDAALQSLQGDHQSAQTELDEHRSTLSRVKGDLESALTTRSDLENNLNTANARIRELESDLHQVSAAAAEAGQRAGTLNGDLETVKTELEKTQAMLCSTELSVAAEKQEKERIASELESAIAARSGLESSLETATGRIRELESELKTAVTDNANTDNQVHALADVLERVK